jgi:Tol biopolymer transport system component
VPFADVELLPVVNDPSAIDDTTPFLREDGAVLYFASTRVPEDSTDLYRSERGDAGFEAPAPVAELNTSFSETAPVVAPDDRTLYFASDRSDGNARGGYDIWVATRSSPSEPFAPPIDVTALNSPDFDLPTFVTRDGCHLYFSSTRSGVLSVYVASKVAR